MQVTATFIVNEIVSEWLTSYMQDDKVYRLPLYCRAAVLNYNYYNSNMYNTRL